jgi:predicted transcriptional regulator
VQTAQRLVALVQQDTQRIQNAARVEQGRPVGKISPKSSASLLRVLSQLSQRPVCSLRQLGTRTSTSFPTVSKAMQTLVELGIARELTGQRRNRVFVYDAYMSILNEDAQAL